MQRSQAATEGKDLNTEATGGSQSSRRVPTGLSSATSDVLCVLGVSLRVGENVFDECCKLKVLAREIRQRDNRLATTAGGG